MGIVELLLLPVLAVGWLLYFIYIFFAFVTASWAFFDARSRENSGCLVWLLVFFLFWPLGLIIWLVLRPPRR